MKNPFRVINIYKKATSVLDVLDRAKTDCDRGIRNWYLSSEWWSALLGRFRDLMLALPLPATIHGRLMMKNWKTTLAGIAAILSVATKIVTTGSINWETDAPAIMAGIGLIAAKDSNVTGGTTRQ